MKSEKLFKEAFIKKMLGYVSAGQMSFSRMVELLNGEVENSLIYSIKLTKVKMREQSIEAAIQSCEHKEDWICRVRGFCGAILSGPDVCKGRECPGIKKFIQTLDNPKNNE